MRTKTIVTLAVALAAVGALAYFVGGSRSDLEPGRGPASSETGWYRSPSNDESTKYSDLRQINRDNVDGLGVAWTFHTLSPANSEATPVFANGKLFVVDPVAGLVALDAGTGSRLWSSAMSGTIGRRGITLQGDNVFVSGDDGVHVLKQADGAPNAAYGNNGIIGTEKSVLPPVVRGGKLYVANIKWSVEAYQLPRGDRLFSTSLSANGVAPRIWSGLSYDQVTHQLFIVTSNAGNLSPRDDGRDGSVLGRIVSLSKALFLHGYRLARDLVHEGKWSSGDYAASLLAIDADTGKVNWSFQEITNENWDLDMVGAPIVTTVNQRGAIEQVVVAVSKSGNVILLDRMNGKPLFGLAEQSSPASNRRYFDDRLKRYVSTGAQKKFVLPEPFADTEYRPEVETQHMAPADRDYVLHKARNALFEKFSQLTERSDVVMFGLHGGAEWPGGAIDPTRGLLIVPSNRVPWILRSKYIDTTKDSVSRNLAETNATYQLKCAECHGTTLAGRSQNEFVGDLYYPALIGITKKRAFDEWGPPDRLAYLHEHALLPEGRPLEISLSDSELTSLSDLFKSVDSALEERGGLTLTGFWQYLFDASKRPASAPPWGYVSAISLASGRTAWKVPFGVSLQTGAQGDFNIGVVMTTSGDLVFATGTRDGHARAFDVETGNELWSAKMAFPGSAPPMTYMHDGCQYVVFTATGGMFVGFGDKGDATIAYKLPSCVPGRP